MEFLFNDLSLHGQFRNISSFRTSLVRVMKMRTTTKRFGREIYCHSNMTRQQVTPEMTIQQAIQSFKMEEQRPIMQWLTRQGPFGDYVQTHAGDDYLEHNGEVVTDTAIGEAGFRCINGSDLRLVSLDPSDWNISPIPVSLHRDETEETTTEVINYWDNTNIEADLHNAPLLHSSWQQLEKDSQIRFLNLTFLPNSFDDLFDRPFINAAALSIIERLSVLNRLKSCFDKDKKRTPEGIQIIQKFFTGDNALFSPSATGEKNKFKKKLTFKHPTKKGETLFCHWHGKVTAGLIRIHFSWPIEANKPLYVAYVGEKLTKK